MFFMKWHGLGNDFVIVDARRDGLADAPGELARAVCDRHFGIGADGLVFILPAAGADAEMRIFNSDGSEAEMCGNAIRCVARYLFETGGAREPRLRIATGAGVLVPEVIPAGGGEPARVRVDMGPPRLSRDDIPMAGSPGRAVNEPLAAGGRTFNVTAVSMGNPHCVIFVPDLDAVPLETLGPVLETHPAFPRKTNVEFVQLLSPEAVRVRVWERGAGPTLACGTGACAVAVAANLNGLTGRRVSVHLPGGVLEIEWAGDGHVYMTGPAVKVFEGRYCGAAGTALGKGAFTA
ncbi:MAG: diaminopimelate epimerase [Bacillota bacterium]|nr:diaminopimelate epimerase [Bacillota bacterium]